MIECKQHGKVDGVYLPGIRVEVCPLCATHGRYAEVVNAEYAIVMRARVKPKDKDKGESDRGGH